MKVWEVADNRVLVAEPLQLEAKDFFLSSGDGCEGEGQAVDLKLRAPRLGKYDLTLYIVSGMAGCLCGEM